MKITGFLIAILFVLNGAMVAQNVGFGTDAPKRQVHIHGNANSFTAALFTNNASGQNIGDGMNIGLSFVADNADQTFGIINVIENAPLYFATNNFVRASLNSSGNLGLGVISNIQSRLHIVGASGSNMLAAQTSTTGIGLTINNSGTDLIQLGFNAGRPVGATTRMSTGHAGLLRFDRTTGDLSVMVSSASGEINTSPAFWTPITFHGTTGYTSVGRYVGFNIPAHPDSGRVAIAHNSSVGSPTLQLVETSTTDYARLEFANQANNRFWHIAGHNLQSGIADDRLNFYHPNAGDIISLRGDGRVGIGGINSHATGYKLSVQGKIMCEELRVQLYAAWPDYVFGNTYNLRSIKELENFIQDNKHLPGIPSAATVEKDGLDVGDMQKRMMEKIEELTLYIIQQQKEIDALKSAIQN